MTLLCEAGPEVEFYPWGRFPRIPRSVFSCENACFCADQPQKMTGREADEMTRCARLQPHEPNRQQRAVDEDLRPAKREVGRRGDAHVPAAGAPRNALRVGLALGGDEQDERAAVALEADGPRGLARRTVDARRELLEAPRNVRVAQKRRDALNRLGPHQDNA